jgi:hypothetical protein
VATDGELVAWSGGQPFRVHYAFSPVSRAISTRERSCAPVSMLPLADSLPRSVDFRPRTEQSTDRVERPTSLRA